MKRYQLHMQKETFIIVEAHCEDDATEKAFEQVTRDQSGDWECLELVELDEEE